MIRLLYLLAACSLLRVAASEKCPQEYLRLSDHHSFCLPKKEGCTIVKEGLGGADREGILQRHNHLRSQIAEGKIGRPDLPTASDMIEMVWDKELEAIAQKWTQQCEFEHDCADCRSDADFSAGQNLGKMTLPCDTENCGGSAEDRAKWTPDWATIVDLWYGEVKHVTADVVRSYKFSMEYGHFSTVAWSKTWRIGCGYVVFMETPKSITKLYACDYAPSPNWLGVPIYKPGKPATECPVNSHPSTVYPGLCKMDDPDTVPLYADEVAERKTYIYDCDFSKDSGDCQRRVDGLDKWRVVKRMFGNVLTTVLKAGQKSTVTFTKKIKPDSEFCLVFDLRKGPDVAGQKDDNVCKADIQQPPSMPDWVVDVGIPGWHQFIPTPLPCFKAETAFSLTFSVPEGAPDQFVEVRRIFAYPGKCKRY